MKKLLVATVFLGLAFSVNAQMSKFIEAGKSGLGLRGAAHTGYRFYGFGGDIGGTLKGKFDIGGSFFINHFFQKENELLTDDATSSYFTGRVTWWAFRQQIVPAIDVSFGLVGGFEANTYDNYKSNSEDGRIITYNSWAEGSVGFETAVTFAMVNSWFVQPSLYLRYEIGSDKQSKESVVQTSGFMGITSNFGLSLFKRFENGNSLFFSAEEFFDTYDTNNFYSISLGYAVTF